MRTNLFVWMEDTAAVDPSVEVSLGGYAKVVVFVLYLG